ncbi:MAG: thiolase family protein [Planctomycetota bacterium]
MNDREAYVVAAVRTPTARAKRGALRWARPEHLAAVAVRGALDRVPGLEPGDIDDVVMGTAFPEGPQGMNLARMVAQRVGLPDSVAGETINRFCASGLQAIAHATQAIRAGHADVMIAGGVESMSQVPMTGFFFQPDPETVGRDPDTLLSMGLTAENVARAYSVSREDQDDFALRSHQRATHAIDSGAFNEEIVPTPLSDVVWHNGHPQRWEQTLEVDEGPRADTSLEALGALRPAFHAKGTVTAGNASPMSDGAAAAVVMSGARVRATGARPLGVLRAYAVSGTAPEMMGIGPVEAIPKALRQADLTLADLDVIELNEAFAAQALAVIRTVGLDEERVNVNGGAIALGHPLGCTGAKLTATLLSTMARRDQRCGLVTMCVGGGMGAAGIFERVVD